MPTRPRPTSGWPTSSIVPPTAVHGPWRSSPSAATGGRSCVPTATSTSSSSTAGDATSRPLPTASGTPSGTRGSPSTTACGGRATCSRWPARTSRSRSDSSTHASCAATPRWPSRSSTGRRAGGTAKSHPGWMFSAGWWRSVTPSSVTSGSSSSPISRSPTAVSGMSPSSALSCGRCPLSTTTSTWWRPTMPARCSPPPASNCTGAPGGSSTASSFRSRTPSPPVSTSRARMRSCRRSRRLAAPSPGSATTHGADGASPHTNRADPGADGQGVRQPVASSDRSTFPGSPASPSARKKSSLRRRPTPRAMRPSASDWPQ